ncbi:hypothetical protein M7I_4769 [Glarea lozoyensis 74030]|uniref:C2H2-type domain-containing protein n=1 Tax=Glarea lozoyensis (strain ATCC 74030 / MF5533) TaxID=1104152 RepID=H0EQ26_GLAL7|nr:hypothetical protein M7I_4769 [Glarea lozoyensis 74030]
MRNRTEYGQTSGDFREDDLLTFDNDGPESAQAKSVKATPEIIYGKPSRPTPNPTPNPTKLRPSTEATPSKPRGLSARFEAGDLISFDETSQNLKDPRDVPPQRTAKGVYGSSTGSQISSAKGPNNPQLKSAWSTKKDLFPSTEKVTPSVGFANPPLPEPSSTIVNTGTPPQNEARRDGPKPLVLSPFDPDNPTFRADSFFDPDILPLGKYKCPHTGCGCLRYFASATALTQHSESQGVNCNVRDTDQFTACVDEFTAGTAAPAGRFKDNTIKYVVNKFDKLEIDKAKAALDAANKAHAADQATFWTRHVPKY